MKTEILSIDQVAAEYHPLRKATLQFWRHQGTGPRSFKLGGRVVYKREDVEAWIEQQYNAEAGGELATAGK
jgi:predicted DNA-binding transcriptional regulator AlpA